MRRSNSLSFLHVVRCWYGVSDAMTTGGGDNGYQYLNVAGSLSAAMCDRYQLLHKKES